MKKKNETVKRNEGNDEADVSHHEKDDGSQNEIKEKEVITPLTQEFGNGDLNVLRDKINEVIKRG